MKEKSTEICVPGGKGAARTASSGSLPRQVVLKTKQFIFRKFLDPSPLRVRMVEDSNDEIPLAAPYRLRRCLSHVATKPVRNAIALLKRVRATEAEVLRRETKLRIPQARQRLEQLRADPCNQPLSNSDIL